jgi:hypothetical protein
MEDNLLKWWIEIKKMERCKKEERNLNGMKIL